MVIDESLLESKIIAIRTKLEYVSDERHKLKILLHNATIIQLIEVPDPTDDEPLRKKKIVPKDKILGIQFTNARRQLIYDKILADAAKLD